MRIQVAGVPLIKSHEALDGIDGISQNGFRNY